jgi:putative SOS response-associated peptidase YedK
MCGRFSVVDRIAPSVSNLFNTHYNVITNTNFSPSQVAATITSDKSGYQQVNAAWGIKPNWSKRLIINAQSETATTKPTFKHAFKHQRCLVPCNGWFEWRNEKGKKAKYFFEHVDKVPMYMAGILFKHEMTELVTLTTAPNAKCSQYHKRMPLLILPHHTEYWFNANTEQVTQLLTHVGDEMINVYNAD